MPQGTSFLPIVNGILLVTKQIISLFSEGFDLDKLMKEKNVLQRLGMVGVAVKN